MIRNVGIPQEQYVIGKNTGKTHNRVTELATYRKSIDVANEQLFIATSEGNLDVAKFYSEIIDKTQEKINAIIDQEDSHSTKKMDSYVSVGKSAVDIAGKAAPFLGSFCITA